MFFSWLFQRFLLWLHLMAVPNSVLHVMFYEYRKCLKRPPSSSTLGCTNTRGPKKFLPWTSRRFLQRLPIVWAPSDMCLGPTGSCHACPSALCARAPCFGCLSSRIPFCLPIMKGVQIIKNKINVKTLWNTFSWVLKNYLTMFWLKMFHTFIIQTFFALFAVVGFFVCCLFLIEFTECTFFFRLPHKMLFQCSCTSCPGTRVPCPVPVMEVLLPYSP